MEKFIWYNPTKLYFGKNQIEKLDSELKNYNNVLFVYGGGTIKRIGLYDSVIKSLKKANKNYVELSGVKPNPKLSTVRKGIDIVKEDSIDLILAVGGGSTIDTAKAIAVGAVSDENIMDILLGKVKVENGIDIGTILTLSATGSEMNPRSVISDLDSNLKLGIGIWDNDATFPKFSICDPTYTLSVPRNQTINGIVDITSHVLEQYFNRNENDKIGNEVAESILKIMFDIGPKLINDLKNYQLRETMMVCGTMAWNGMLRGLTNNGDWACHKIEHALSAVYDIPHGEGLAIVTPVWMEYCSKKDPQKFIRFAKKVFDVKVDNKTNEEIAQEGIDRYKEFLYSIGVPKSMKHYGVTDYDLDSLVHKTMLNQETIGYYIKLTNEDVFNILNKIF